VLNDHSESLPWGTRGTIEFPAHAHGYAKRPSRWSGGMPVGLNTLLSTCVPRRIEVATRRFHQDASEAPRRARHHAGPFEHKTAKLRHSVLMAVGWK